MKLMKLMKFSFYVSLIVNDVNVSVFYKNLILTILLSFIVYCFSYLYHSMV